MKSGRDKSAFFSSRNYGKKILENFINPKFWLDAFKFKFFLNFPAFKFYLNVRSYPCWSPTLSLGIELLWIFLISFNSIQISSSEFNKFLDKLSNLSNLKKLKSIHLQKSDNSFYLLSLRAIFSTRTPSNSLNSPSSTDPLNSFNPSSTRFFF